MGHQSFFQTRIFVGSCNSKELSCNSGSKLCRYCFMFKLGRRVRSLAWRALVSKKTVRTLKNVSTHNQAHIKAVRIEDWYPTTKVVATDLSNKFAMLDEETKMVCWLLFTSMWLHDCLLMRRSADSSWLSPLRVGHNFLYFHCEIIMTVLLPYDTPRGYFASLCLYSM